jgi:hypothetical protein
MRFTLKSALATTSLLLGLAMASPAAAVQCGDTIGPNQTVTLQADLLCDLTTGGLTVIGPAEVHLAGYDIKCQDLTQTGAVPVGIEILGRKAKVYGSSDNVFGIVSDCFYGGAVRGEGRHTVEGVMVQRGHEAGFYVASGKNTLRQNYTDQGPYGFVVEGQSTNNKLFDNFAIFHGHNGFHIHGSKHQLQRNTAALNEGDGFRVNGVGHKLRGNLADRNGFDGFDVQGDAQQVTLQQNRATANGKEGFEVSGQKHRLTQNLAYENENSGIDVEDDASNIVLMRNEALDNNQGNDPDSFDLTDQTPDCDTNTWKNNTFETASQPCIR